MRTAIDPEVENRNKRMDVGIYTSINPVAARLAASGL